MQHITGRRTHPAITFSAKHKRSSAKKIAGWWGRFLSIIDIFGLSETRRMHGGQYLRSKVKETSISLLLYLRRYIRTKVIRRYYDIIIIININIYLYISSFVRFIYYYSYVPSYLLIRIFVPSFVRSYLRSYEGINYYYYYYYLRIILFYFIRLPIIIII